MSAGENRPRPLQTQICVIGCGQCGSNIAAYFDKMPSFLQHRDWDSYPFKCAAVDTNPAAAVALQQHPWDWKHISDIHILPLASTETVLKRLFGEMSAEGRRSEKSGAGGFPYMGTLAAEEHLLNKSPVGKDLMESFIARGFTSGCFLFVNSLSGGTGTGFSPIMPEFFSDISDPRIILNLSIVPQYTFLKNRKQAYPANIIYGLFQLAHSKRVDAVILADNDIMSRKYGCKGNPEYNSLLHEILSGVLLNTIGKYGCPSFGKNIDPADIRRTLKPAKGFGDPELCTLSFACKKPPRQSTLRLKSLQGRVGYFLKLIRGIRSNPKSEAAERKARYIDRWMRSLINSIVDKGYIKTTVGTVKADVIYGAVGVLAGPPEFFDQILEGIEEYFNSLKQYIMERITENFMLAFLQFPEMKQVTFSLILSGITSEKLEELYEEVVPPGEKKTGGTLMQRIRRLNRKTVEDIMLKEVRRQLSEEASFDGEDRK